MKKVTIILPDKIIRVIGSHDNSKKKEIDVNAQNIINALVTDDYHMNYFFNDRKKIKVVSIKNIDADN